MAVRGDEVPQPVEQTRPGATCMVVLAAAVAVVTARPLAVLGVPVPVASVLAVPVVPAVVALVAVTRPMTAVGVVLVPGVRRHAGTLRTGRRRPARSARGVGEPLLVDA
jgi:hypothetical protein